jgi:hypothetical protein
MRAKAWTEIKLWCPEIIRERRDVGAYRGEAPRRGSRGASSVRPLLPVEVRHRGVARGSVRRIEVDGKVISITHHYAFPPC